MKQKKTDKSRLGVNQSCIVELHSNVPHILKNPAMKQANINTGTLRVYMLIRLQIISAVQQVSKATLDVKRNFSRNMMAKVRAIPTMEA